MIVFVAIPVPVSMLWLPVHVLNLSMRFLQVFGLSGHCLTALLGEFGHFDPIWHILMVPASSVGVIECIVMHQTCLVQ